MNMLSVARRRRTGPPQEGQSVTAGTWVVPSAQQTLENQMAAQESPQPAIFLPRSDRSALEHFPDGPLFLSLELLKLAQAQRAQLNFSVAAMLFRAARAVSTSAPTDEEAAQLAEAIERHVSQDARMEEMDAESVLRMAENFDPFANQADAPHAVRWPDAAPAPPLRRTRCHAATAAAVVGEADCRRILGDTATAATLLGKLRFVDEGMVELEHQEAAKAARKAGLPIPERVPEDAPTVDDPAATDGFGEGPRALVAFLLELSGGVGGDGHGKVRIPVLLKCAQDLTRAPPCPEVVWRVLGASCDQRPGLSDDGSTDAAYDEEGEGTGDAEAGGDHGAGAAATAWVWPQDEMLCLSALSAAVNPDMLLDAAVQCMHSRRPRDALACLTRLESIRGFWECTHGANLPDHPDKDRSKTARVVYDRATWLQGGGYLDCAYASIGSSMGRSPVNAAMSIGA